jgi:NAD(P)H-nitrite reductase large subunit
MAAVAPSPQQGRQYVVIGGGIAGCTVAHDVVRLDSDECSSVTLVSASPVLKLARAGARLSKRLVQLRVEERPTEEADVAETLGARVRLERCAAVGVDPRRKCVRLADGRELRYDRLALCTGARPNLVLEGDPRVLGIRDTESVEELSRRLAGARRVLVVGNGGIALELVFCLRGVEVVWAIRDAHIGSAFFDDLAAAFVLPLLFPEADPKVDPARAAAASSSAASSSCSAAAAAAAAPRGAGLGPRWLDLLDDRFANREGKMSAQPSVRLELGVAVESVRGRGDDARGPLEVRLSNGRVYECDVVVSATGVVPNTEFLGREFRRGGDGGVAVNERLETSCRDVFAAGDCASCEFADGRNWFQMRLWSQAQVTAGYCARAMVGDVDELGFAFDVFAHATQFFGLDVALLGRFNGQGLGERDRDFSVILRCEPGRRFAKLVLVRGRVVGAVLIGDCGLAVGLCARYPPLSRARLLSLSPARLHCCLTTLAQETLENLILNETDVTQFGERLLDPELDVEDYFD